MTDRPGQRFIHVQSTAVKPKINYHRLGPTDWWCLFVFKVVDLPRQRRSLNPFQWVANPPGTWEASAGGPRHYRATAVPSVTLNGSELRAIRHFRLAHWITAYLWKRGLLLVGSVNATAALLRAAKKKKSTYWEGYTMYRGDFPLLLAIIIIITALIEN
ncbi:hypothetical protein PspLS_10419, partial [Pyricularia sp. CBS 133598]